MRITPAPAGKTSPSQVNPNSYKDHPRTCGENAYNLSRTKSYKGSPPHLRRAYSGKERIKQEKDHPRTCGEDFECIRTNGSHKGSPPHLRGTRLKSRSLLSVSIRITPAPAGKTVPLMSFHLQIQDHPRTCGENAVQLQVLKNTTGSPPHLRGKLAKRNSTGGNAGITPAPAGKTLLSPPR